MVYSDRKGGFGCGSRKIKRLWRNILVLSVFLMYV